MKVSYFYLLLNIHCSHCTQNCIFCTFRRLKKTCFVTKNYSESSHICVFILSKSSLIDTSKSHITQEWLVVELLDPSLDRIFNVQSIGVQYTLSFQWTNFGLKWLWSWTFSSDSKKPRNGLKQVKTGKFSVTLAFKVHTYLQVSNTALAKISREKCLLNLQIKHSR